LPIVSTFPARNLTHGPAAGPTVSGTGRFLASQAIRLPHQRLPGLRKPGPRSLLPCSDREKHPSPLPGMVVASHPPHSILWDGSLEASRDGFVRGLLAAFALGDSPCRNVLNPSVSVRTRPWWTGLPPSAMTVPLSDSRRVQLGMGPLLRHWRR